MSVTSSPLPASSISKNGTFPVSSIALYLTAFQTLAVDLLNPSLEHEKQQHKLKRLVQSPNSYFMDVKCPGAPDDALHNSLSNLDLRLFRHHNRVLTRPDSRYLLILCDRPLPADRRKG